MEELKAPHGQAISITLNGKPREVAAYQTLAGLLDELDLRERLVVVERNGSIVNRADFPNTSLAAGDVLEICSTGGGGYGAPRQRPVEAVLADLCARLLSVEKARREYGVVVDPATFALDEEATRQLRSQPDRQEDNA